MNAEELDIARRLVACKGWVWLPGMVAVRLNGDEAVSSIRIDVMDDVVQMAIHGTSTRWHAVRFPVRGRTPDISDDLTRLGVLAVVRRAWGMPLLCTYPVKMADCAPWWNVGVPWSRESCGVFCGTGATELHALLAALEAAP